MKAEAKMQVDLINQYICTLPEPDEIKRSLQSGDSEFETKIKTRTIKAHIFKPMKNLINTVDTMITEQQVYYQQMMYRLHVLESNGTTFL